jgi:neutral ceramidase
MVTWFPVHCTSMNNTNHLVSGDNKGAAEQLAERWARRPAPAGLGADPGFLAAFVQSNVGDTSPNVLGAFCLDTGTLHAATSRKDIWG